MRKVLAMLALLVLPLGASALDGPVAWRGHSFVPVESISALPPAIRRQIGADAKGIEGVADRGQPFNRTDVVDESLPMRRFAAAGHDGDMWVVALEQGGRGYEVVVTLFLPDGSLHSYSVPRTGSSLGQILENVPRDER
jgi:hypothetical protein